MKAAFCSHMGFLTTFSRATSMISPWSLRLTSTFMPLLGVTSTILPCPSLRTSSLIFLTVSVSCRTTSCNLPVSSRTTSTTPISSGFFTTTAVTRLVWASLVTASAPLTGSPLVNTWGPPARPTTLAPMIRGVTNCTTDTPKLPMPAWMPRASPCSRFGKKMEVEGMKDEKSPPPMPHRKPMIMKVSHGVFRSWMA